MSDTYRDCLRQYGLKSTKARNRVLDVLSHKTGVMTVEAVYAELLEGGDKGQFFDGLSHLGNVYQAGAD